MKRIDEPDNVVYGLFCACARCRASHPGAIRYVGKTVKRPSERRNGHISKARNGDGRPVSCWIRKHGPENVRYTILDTAEPGENLYDSEQYWIGHLGTTTYPGLNLTDGGPGSTGLVFSQERRANIGRGRAGIPVSPEALIELRNGLSNRRKLTQTDLYSVKERIWDGDSYSDIARSHGVSVNVISRIAQDKSATDIPWPSDRPRVMHDRAYHQRVAALRRREAGVKKSPRPSQIRAIRETRLSIREIRYIRELARNTSLTHREIAAEFPDHVTTVMVGKILRGERWEWVL